MCRTYILVLIFNIIICDVRGQGTKPTISPYPVASVEKGQGLTLTCDYTGEDITLLTIRRNGLNIGLIRILDTNPCAVYQQLANTTLYNVECLRGNKFRVTILNVSEDENNSAWQCEVRVNGSFVPSDETRIQVIVGITSVSLVSPSGSSVSVVENKVQQFQCETSAGNPQATVEWYKNKGTPNSLVDDSLITTGNTTETSPSGTLLVTIGKLTFAVEKGDNGVGVYCRANNGGSWRYSSRSVNLDVQFAPTIGPVIQDVTSPYYMIRSSSTTQQLTCTVTGGNPLASLTWSCYGSSSTGKVQDETVTSTVTWRAGTNDDSTCTCTGSHVVGWSRSTSVDVRVLYAPSAPKCSVGSSTVFSGKLKIVRGSTLTINCSSVGNPLPDFTWTLPNVGTRSGPELTVNNVQTAATFALSVTNTMRPSIGQPQFGSNNTYFFIEILFPPSTPAFHYGNTTGTHIPNNQLTLIRGNSFTVGCVSSANPGPSYTLVGTSQLWMSTANTNISKECRVKNTMTPTGYDPVSKEASATLEITVLYPPLSPVLQYRTCDGVMTSVTSPLKAIEGQSVKVDCKSDSSPSPRYSWSAYQSQISHEFAIVAVDKQHHGSYTCSVSNNMVTTFDGTVPGMNNSTFNLDLLFPPVVNRFDNMTALEGTTAMVNCTITPGNPPETTIKWTRNQTEMTSQQQLRIEKITRQQSGVYTCSASNVMRPSGCDSKTEPDHKDVYLDVQYPSEVIDANVVNFEGKATVTINESLTVPFSVICNVDGNPKSHIKLLRNGYVIQEAPQISSLLFTQPNSNCERDMAVYTCTGSNNHNAQVSLKNLRLFVQCKPRPEHNFSLDANVTTSTGVNATLTFKVAAYPRPTVEDYIWEKLEQNGSWTQLLNSSFVYYVVLENNLTTHLTIKDVAESDLSSYRVNVSNTLGTTSHIFYLQAEDKPHPPSDLKYKLVKDVNRVVLNWTPGFDGGLTQNFTIEYKIGSTTRWLQEQVGIGTFNHTLTRLDYGKQYDARVFAVNSKGSSNYSNLIKFVTASKKVDMTSNNAPIIGGVIGGCLGLVVVVIVVVVILRRKYKIICNMSLEKKEDVRSWQEGHGAENAGYNAAMTYESVSITKEPSVYDALSIGNDGPDKTHVYTQLDESHSKSHVFYENVKKEDPVYNNTVLKTPMQTVL